MGFLSNLFGKQSAETNLTEMKNIPVKKGPDLLSVHPDIRDLIWLNDGPNKNYSPDKKESIYEYEGLRFVISSMSREEPSSISLKLPVSFVEDSVKVERPPYYPRYAQLTPEQRGEYWKLLANPYKPGVDIGYIFILYYGLERHLLNGNYEKAFDVVLKLRDVHQNGSFQIYSANALILTGLYRQRPDLIRKFVRSIDHDFELIFSDNLYLLCMFGLDIPLSAKDIMQMAKTFEFTNLNYIKKYPDIFEEVLVANIQQKYNADVLNIKDFINEKENRKLHVQNTCIFANMSIIDTSIQVPQIADNFKLKKAVYDLLEETHEQTKVKLASLRKSGELKAEVKAEPKKKVIPVFDSDMEKTLQKDLISNKDDAYDRHFSLIALQNFYYKYRDVDEKYVDKCIIACNEDINSLPNVQRDYRKQEIKIIKQLSKYHSILENDAKVSNVGYFTGVIPAFSRLAIIYEKNKKYSDALNVCDQAIKYYSSYGMSSQSQEFEERKEKLLKKVM